MTVDTLDLLTRLHVVSSDNCERILHYIIILYTLNEQSVFLLEQVELVQPGLALVILKTFHLSSKRLLLFSSRRESGPRRISENASDKR